MKAVVIGGSLAGIEAAILLRRQGFEVELITTGTYLGDDVAMTWRWYDSSNVQEAFSQLQELAIRYSFAFNKEESLTPAFIKRYFMMLMQKESVRIRYMTRCLGAITAKDCIKGILAAGKNGVFRVPCDLAVDATLLGEPTCHLSGLPPKLCRGQALTLRMEVSGAGCSDAPINLPDVGAVLSRSTRDASHVFLTATRLLPKDMSVLEARQFTLGETVSIIKQLRYCPLFSNAVLGDALPYALDIAAIGDMPVPPINGWYRITGIGGFEPIVSRSFEEAAEEALLYGKRIPFSIDKDGHVSLNWQSVPHHETGIFIAGTGTAGVWAAISAARAGADVFAVDMQPYPGGTRTMGGMSGMYMGNRNLLFQSLWQELLAYSKKLSPADEFIAKPPVVTETLFYAGQLSALSVNWKPSTLVCAAILDECKQLAGVACLGEDGPFVVHAQRYIDATGDADLAVLSGCNTVIGDDDMQLTQNYSQWQRCASNRCAYRPIDQDVIDPAVPEEWTRTLEKNIAETAEFDLFDMLTVRESRRIVGRVTTSMEDVARGKRTRDVIYEAYCTYDPHGRCFHLPGRLGLLPALGKGRWVSIPLRALMPVHLDHFLVIGKAISMDQDAFNYIRMCPDVISTGWVAGLLMSLSIQNGCALDALDLTELQGQWVKTGALTKEPPEKTAYDTSPARIAAQLLDGEEDAFAEAVLTNYPQIPEILRQAWPLMLYVDRMLIEKTLLWYGDISGADYLLQKLEALDAQDGTVIYADRQGETGVIKGGIHGEPDSYWLINQLMVLLSKAKYRQAVSVIRKVMAHTIPGSSWDNDASIYASIRLDCQTVENYDRILCVAEAAILMPDTSYTNELLRICQEVQAIRQERPSFYQEYLMLRLALAIAQCDLSAAKSIFEQLQSSEYSAIVKHIAKVLSKSSA